MNPVISALAHDQVEAVCALARTVWRHHYPAIIGTAQTEYMLARRYDPALVRAELARLDLWWDVLEEDGALVAFSCSIAESPGELKLDKLYVHPERQRRGHGRALIEHACERALSFGCCALVLAVNKRNAAAIGAYAKHGFSIREAVVKDIGGGFVMDDYIMERKLEARAP